MHESLSLRMWYFQNFKNVESASEGKLAGPPVSIHGHGTVAWQKGRHEHAMALWPTFDQTLDLLLWTLRWRGGQHCKHICRWPHGVSLMALV